MMTGQCHWPFHWRNPNQTKTWFHNDLVYFVAMWRVFWKETTEAASTKILLLF
jgi:hypothetical protein